MYVADLHIHSKYSRATSRDCTPESLDLWARKKGIHILGTGDFTHPAWREELKEKLAPAEDGLYTLRREYRREGEIAGDLFQPRFVLSGEISSIYKKDGKVRKVHNVILLPGLEDAERLSHRLEEIGNLHSDGRPILGLDCRDLLEITLEVCADAVFIPAHIWTPHFSLFGAFSGFDSIEECFGDLASHIHALETGLSSDPPMNWRLLALDSFQLISNSDAHSPAKLGREANLLDIDLSYQSLSKAIQSGEGLLGTLEFYPEEGKYHYDGHRKCRLCLSPAQARSYQDRCPVCGRKLTIGVLHRVEELADRAEDFILRGAKPFESIVPLPEVIAASTGKSPSSVKVSLQYESMLRSLGTEFSILREVPLEDIRKSAGARISEGIRRLRAGLVERNPGYDGEYGSIRLFSDSQLLDTDGQLNLFSAEEMDRMARAETAASAHTHFSEQALQNPQASPCPPASNNDHTPAGVESSALSAPALNDRQTAAVRAVSRTVSVVAGPGTGKTKTLVSRILYLLEERNVKPSEITAVTFTNKAAEEMKSRLGECLGRKQALRSLTVGTFHSICRQILRDFGMQFVLADQFELTELAGEVVGKWGLSLSATQFLREVSLRKTGLSASGRELPQDVFDSYQKLLTDHGFLDFDDLLLITLKQMEERSRPIRQFSYLLVDEFQDVSPLQYRLIRAWNKLGKELFVIGDPDQSIYGFRGSDPKCFDKLQNDCPEIFTVVLDKNYRSTPQILNCALSVITRGGIDSRELYPAVGEGAPVRIVAASGGLQEGIFIAREINRIVGGIDMLEAHNLNRPEMERKPLSFSDIAILYRTHRQAGILETCLQKEGIPYVVAGREDFLEDALVRGTIAFFRSLIHPEDTFSRRLGIKLIWENGPMKTESPKEAAESFGPLVLKDKPAKILEVWTSYLGCLDSVPLNKLRSMSIFFKTLRDFLDRLSFGEEADLLRCSERSYRSDSVTLSTLHGSKGLEYPVVFLCGSQKGKIPLEHKGKIYDEGEERRLFYVGLTRAKQELLLTAASDLSVYTELMPDTSFIKESLEKEKSSVQMSVFDFLSKP